MLTPRPEQEADIRAILNEPTKAALVGHTMGAGKTLLGSEVIIRSGAKRALIIGVKDTAGQWAETLNGQAQVFLKRIDSTVGGTRHFAELLAGEDGVYFIGAQLLARRDWTTVGSESKMLGIYRKMKPVDVLVFDEVHMASNRTSNVRKSLGTIKADLKIGMSGTWVANRFENAWSITRWLWPELIPARFYSWREQWCATKKTYTPHGAVDSVTGERVPGAFAASLPLYLRREAKEYPPAPKTLRVQLSDEQRRIYDRLETDLLVWLEHEELEGKHPLIIDIPPNLKERLRTVALGVPRFNADGKLSFADDCESSKLAALHYLLTDRWKGKQVGIYCHSKEFVHVVVKQLNAAGFRAAEWSGDVSSKKRDQIKAAFIAGELDYIVGLPEAMGVGIDGLQAVCNKVAWLSKSFSEMHNDQALGRYFRPGRIADTVDDVFETVEIVADQTVDEGIFSSLIQQHQARNAELRAAA